MRLVPIELHGFLIRKYCKQCLCIIWLDLPEAQSICVEGRKMCKRCIDGHTKAPLETSVVLIVSSSSCSCLTLKGVDKMIIKSIDLEMCCSFLLIKNWLKLSKWRL